MPIFFGDCLNKSTRIIIFLIIITSKFNESYKTIYSDLYSTSQLRFR